MNTMVAYRDHTLSLSPLLLCLYWRYKWWGQTEGTSTSTRNTNTTQAQAQAQTQVQAQAQAQAQAWHKLQQNKRLYSHLTTTAIITTATITVYLRWYF
jgi:hypothetical protein